MIRLSFLFIALLGLVSCVGTVDKAAVLETSLEVNGENAIVFEGAAKAYAISHKKIDVLFKAASGGSGKGFSYRVYLNGGTIPVNTSAGSSAVTDSSGYFHLPVSGLTKSTTYSFTVKAFDEGYRKEDKNSVEVLESTLYSAVPLFSGVESLTPLAGVAGESGLHLTWSAATPGEEAVDPLASNPHAISGYKVYAGPSESTLSLVTVVGPNGVGVIPTSYDLKGLASGSKYCVRVRALNTGDETVVQSEDRNETTVCNTTKSATAIAFGGLDAAVVPPDASGYFQAKLSWTQATGAFDRYVVLASSNPIFLNQSFNLALGDGNLFRVAEIVLNDNNPNPTQYTLTGLSPETTYHIAVLACLGTFCTTALGENVLKHIYTLPTVAQFPAGFAPTVTSPEGADSLDSLDLTYVLPSKTQGHYDDASGIRVYITNLSGTVSEANRIFAYDPLTPNTPGYLQDPQSNTTIRIKGLTDGQTYYFIIKSVLTDPRVPGNLVYSNNALIGSGKVGRVVPDFLGVSSCSALSPTSIQVNWAAPTKGTFDYYEVYAFDRAKDPALGEAFFSTDYLVRDLGGSPADYIFGQAAKVTSSLVLTGLDPATTYRVGVKTYALNPITGLGMRDTNTLVMNCSTTVPSHEFQGWFEIYSIGPKIDGSVRNERTVLPEKIAPDGYDRYGIADSSPSNAIIDGLYKNRYARECTLASDECDSSSSSTEGIIRLVWEDIKISGTLNTLYDYRSLVNEDGHNTVGYKIYRMDHIEGLHASQPPALTDPGWTLLNSDRLIIPKEKSVYKTSKNGLDTEMQQKRIGEWIDYTVSRAGVPSNKTKIYWYKVESYFKGQRLPFDFESTSNLKKGDEIIRVVLPPDNQAFVHRWMMNRSTCEFMLKEYDRSKFYRCEFNGFGSTIDSEDGVAYFDINRHLIVDRFEGGCNYSKSACSAAAGVLRVGTAGSDCIGNNSPEGNVSAPINSVYFRTGDEWAHKCYIKLTAAGNTGWYSINDSNASGARCSNDATGINCKYPAASANYPAGQNLGPIIRTNAARMPSMFSSQYGNYHMCRAFSLDHRGSSVTGRLLRRKEAIAAGKYSPYLTYANAQRLSNGTLYQSVAQRRACNVGTFLQTLTPFTSTYERYNNWPTINLGSGTWGWGTLLTISGSRQDQYNTVSTEACESRFGLHDFYGNLTEPLSDQLSFNGQDATAYGFGALHNFHAISDISALSTFTPFIDPASQEDWKNAKGDYYSVSSDLDTSFSSLDTTWSTANVGNPRAKVANPNNASSYYFNSVLGLTMDCINGLCDNGAEDDKRMSMRSDQGHILIQKLGFISRSWNNDWCSKKALIVPVYGGMWTGGSVGEFTWGEVKDPTYPSKANSGNPRCVFPIDEGDDQ